MVSQWLRQKLSFLDGGLTFTNNGPGAMYVLTGGPHTNGTNNNQFCCWAQTESITKTGGGTFNLISIDFAISYYDSNSSEVILINGTPLTITSTLTTYTLNLLGVSQANISGVFSNTGYWSADNINYSGPSAVPLPAALPHFASGLAGLGLLGWRRKRKAIAA